MRSEVVELEAQASAPDLWDDPAAAQKVTSRLSFVQGELRKVSALRQRLDDLPILVELAEGEGDADSLAEAEKELGDLREGRGRAGGPHAAGRRVRHARGAGHHPLGGRRGGRRRLGRDADAHVHPLVRAPRLAYEVYDISYAEEAGIKSATFAVKAPYAYGTLSVEQGTHRLVRISPFDNQGRRQTSFAAVEVLPVIEQTDHIDIPENEIRVDVFRSSGPGGQSVNTTDSAVRMTHIPTGIVVSCQNEKSQIQNRAAALRVLQARLLERRRIEERAAMDALKTDTSGSWGNQMRSYVLHPYQMVKDLRTEYEAGNTSAVLDGDIDEFIEAGIRWRRQGGA